MQLEPDTLLTLAFTAAFSLWAGVVAFGVKGIRSDLKGISADLRRESEKLNAYIVQTESRLSVLEDRLKLNHKDQ